MGDQRPLSNVLEPLKIKYTEIILKLSTGILNTTIWKYTKVKCTEIIVIVLKCSTGVYEYQCVDDSVDRKLMSNLLKCFRMNYRNDGDCSRMYRWLIGQTKHYRVKCTKWT